MPRKKITSDILMETYIDVLLTNKEQLGSVYQFSKFTKMKEEEFYAHFSSFEAIESAVFVKLFNATIETLKNSEEFETFDKRNQLLLFYYTLFENFKFNRSALKAILKSPFLCLENEKVLRPLKEHFDQFMIQFDWSSLPIDIPQLKKLENLGQKTASWMHFLTLLNYWLEDDSKDFEKTDILIEKSVNTGIDLIESNILNQVLDLGKFLFKDKIKL